MMTTDCECGYKWWHAEAVTVDIDRESVDE